MKNQLPVRLFLDTSKQLALGVSGIFGWWVENASPLVITSLGIEMRCQLKAVAPLRYDMQHKTVSAGRYHHCPLPMKVTEAGDYPIEIHVTGMLDNGERFDLVTTQTPTFGFEGAGESGCVNLKVIGSAIIKGVNTGTFEVGKDAIFDASSLVDQPKKRKITIDHAGAAPIPENLCEFHLSPCMEDGLSPLNLNKFAQVWRQHHYHQLDFVDEKGALMGESVTIKEAYCLHLRSRREGYLTLLSQDTNGIYRAFVPNHLTPDKIDAHRSYFLPGALLSFPLPTSPKDDYIYFDDDGEEWALAFITPQPICAPLDPVSELGSDVVTQLLKRAMSMHDASLALAKITVVPKKFSYL